MNPNEQTKKNRTFNVNFRITQNQYVSSDSTHSQIMREAVDAFNKVIAGAMAKSLKYELTEAVVVVNVFELPTKPKLIAERSINLLAGDAL